MTDRYFVPPGLPYPEFNLAVGSGNHTDKAKAITTSLKLLFEAKGKSGRIPPLWDGQTITCIIAALRQLLVSR